MASAFTAFLIAYLVGSFPTAYLVARANGQDIFALGSNNMGAMNTARNLSMGWGVVVFLIDIIKGALATYVGLWFGAESLAVLAATVGVVVGHGFSVFVGFRGGKGLATAMGASFPIYPWVGIAGLFVIAALSLIFRQRSNIAAVILVVSYPILAAIILSSQGSSGSFFIYTLVSVVIYSLVVLVKHLPDLQNELFEEKP